MGIKERLLDEIDRTCKILEVIEEADVNSSTISHYKVRLDRLYYILTGDESEEDDDEV